MSAGQSLSIVIGAGGAAPISSTINTGSQSSVTRFGTVLWSTDGGTKHSASSGGNGGSGGSGGGGQGGTGGSVIVLIQFNT